MQPVISRVAPNLTFSNSAEAEFGRISELKFGRSRSRIWLKLVFWSQNNTLVIKLMASTMLSAAVEAVHSVLPMLRYCLPVIDKICRMAMNQFCILNYFSSILVFFLALPEIQNTSIVICETCCMVLIYNNVACGRPSMLTLLQHNVSFTITWINSLVYNGPF